MWIRYRQEDLKYKKNYLKMKRGVIDNTIFQTVVKNETLEKTRNQQSSR
jgi:hypothetical protein